MIQCNLLVIKTHQLEITRQFYQSLGIPFQQHRHGNGPIHYAAEMGILVFEIYPLSDQQTIVDSSTRLGFEVLQLDNLIAALSVDVILKKPYQSEWGYQALVRDPDGRKVELTQSLI
ncbi:MAG: glyoxalase/bleomycin resistance/extradiol dioxygenase family protein [Saprospiraceae bacterium]|nr:glyoxalase/bleomycin resistance/extradiol dioxygenase family protein [Saprospiraceae bacterium]